MAKQSPNPQGIHDTDPERQDLVDPILPVASQLRAAYNMSEMDADDGHDS